MKQLFTILIILGVFYGLKELLFRFETIQKREGASESATAEPARPRAAALPGLPPSLEGPHQTAEKLGPEGLKNFLIAYRPSIRDPKLADIELDYVILVSRHDPAEARRVFKAVKDRTPTFSPIYPRIRSLEKTYQ